LSQNTVEFDEVEVLKTVLDGAQKALCHHGMKRTTILLKGRFYWRLDGITGV